MSYFRLSKAYKPLFAALLLVMVASCNRQTASDTAAIDGTVFTDENGNGRQDENEPGIAGVTVFATHPSTGQMTNALTREDGSFHFDMPPGVFYYDVATGSLPPSDYGYQLTTGRVQYELNVPAGESAPGLIFGYIAVPPAVIEGTVFEDLNGDGLQSPDEPGMPGIRVLALTEAGIPELEATTGEDGTYRIEAGAINHRLTADPSSLPRDYNLTTGKARYNLEVEPGFLASDIDFGFRALQPAVVEGIVFQDMNGNGQLDEGEPGLDGITVRATQIAGDGSDMSTTTDSEGRYRFEALTLVHQIAVDESTLPAGATLTSIPASYPVFLNPGLEAPGLNFGYQID